jgi:hypothetical protein
MSKWYTVILRNGARYDIPQETYRTILLMLRLPKKDVPFFVQLDEDTIVSTSAISNIEIDREVS